MHWVTFGKGYDKIAAFSAQIRNFMDSIKGKAMPLINATDGLESVKVIEAAYKSSNMNKWIEVGS
jgi:predicted dehydrogenase